jgi:hypothetical protein
MRSVKRFTYVDKLLTGRFTTEDVRTKNGVKTIRKFSPLVVNKYPTLQKLEEGTGFSKQIILERERLIAAPLDIDRECFAKNKKAKKFLKKIKKMHKLALMRQGFNPKKRLNVSEPMTLR